MPRFLLDTNTVSYALRGDPPSVRERLRRIPMAQICISSITEAELLLGLALKPEAKKLAELVNQFLLGVTSLPWDSAAAQAYAGLSAASWKQGKRLAAMDMLVAAHAFSTGLTLVTSDRSFRNLRPRLLIADWSKPR
ncbi:MAG TPA: type II toxin-antitoxin system VapC family toxin [Candidatus Acidoferrum sp.]|jgi:tRNA(fMet)-specific endonuclease VapC|nr:type II toxin-antitoxin system VapC family toxin [Candidatus Acidoferrum sp.]